MRKSLLRNNCNGTFTDVTRESGLWNTVTRTQTAVWADVDNDGCLDLFAGNENGPSQLFRNKGDGTFEDISRTAGVDRSAFTKAVVAEDYDNDGYVDFYVSNYNGDNLLYHNNRNRTFTEVGKQRGRAGAVAQLRRLVLRLRQRRLARHLRQQLLHQHRRESCARTSDCRTTPRRSKLYRNLGNGHVPGRERRGRARQGADADGRQLRRRQQRRLPRHVPRHGQSVVRLDVAARAAAEPGRASRSSASPLRPAPASCTRATASPSPISTATATRTSSPRSAARCRRIVTRCGCSRIPASATTGSTCGWSASRATARRSAPQITVTVEKRGRRQACGRSAVDPPDRRQRRVVRRQPDGAAHRARPGGPRSSRSRSGGRPAARGRRSPTSTRTSSSRSRSSATELHKARSIRSRARWQELERQEPDR